MHMEGMMVFSWSLGILLMAALVTSSPYSDQLQTDSIIDIVNSAETTWKAGRNFHPSLKKGYAKNLVGVIEDSREWPVQTIVDDDDSEYDIEDFEDLPASFDAREKWKDCVSLQQVRDQGSCGSCWAVSTAAAFTDRLCIASQGAFNGHLSAQQLLTCCQACGSGCQGGSPGMAWFYFLYHGLVTGGDYGSNEGCQPYTFAECEHFVEGAREQCSEDYKSVSTPECQDTCYNPHFIGVGFEQELYTLNDTLAIYPSEFETSELALHVVQKLIYEQGPLTAVFTVYEDFLVYKEGVYQYVTGKKVYGHAVKVIGWGEENDTPYWLVANSWNSDWGDNGFFKIKRGNNECGFEESFYSGIPDVTRFVN